MTSAETINTAAARPTARQMEAAEAAMRLRVPFALFAEPGATEYTFMAARRTPDEAYEAELDNPEVDEFFLSFFLNDGPYIIGIHADMDAEALLAAVADGSIAEPGREAEIQPGKRSTDRLTHAGMLRCLLKRMQEPLLKTVISTVQAVHSRKPVTAVAERYFALLPDTLRWLAFTPETGLWLGATPELLASFDTESHTLRSMALAGTRPSGEEGDWDEKNLREQAMVVAGIQESLHDFCSDFQTTERRNLVFGPVEHIATDIKATYSDKFDIEVLLEALSPTPAVCGLPRTLAAAYILRLEPHMRHCYAAFFGVHRGKQVDAYVNLRCALIESGDPADPAAGRLYNIYAGGGITRQSDPETEWLETRIKSLPLCLAVNPDAATLE